MGKKKADAIEVAPENVLHATMDIESSRLSQTFGIEKISENPADFQEVAKRRYQLPADYQKRQDDSIGIERDENGKRYHKRDGQEVALARGVKLPTINDSSGNMTKIGSAILPIMQLPRCTSDAELIDRYDWLIEYIIANNLQASIELFCMAYDILFQDFRDWKAGSAGQVKFAVAKKYEIFSSSTMIEQVRAGDLNPVVWIFYGKNWYGYSDKRELEVSVNNTALFSEQEIDTIINDLPSNGDIIDI